MNINQTGSFQVQGQQQGQRPKPPHHEQMMALGIQPSGNLQTDLAAIAAANGGESGSTDLLGSLNQLDQTGGLQGGPQGRGGPRGGRPPGPPPEISALLQSLGADPSGTGSKEGDMALIQQLQSQSNAVGQQFSVVG